MSDDKSGNPQASTVDKDFEQLKLLFDYTKFHIGLYTTVATIFGGAIAAKDGPFTFHLWPLQCSIFFICLAGLAGGVIASSCPQYQSYSTFWSSRIGPFRCKLLTTERWSYVEHLSFWIAVLLAIFAVVVR